MSSNRICAHTQCVEYEIISIIIAYLDHSKLVCSNVSYSRTLSVRRFSLRFWAKKKLVIKAFVYVCCCRCHSITSLRILKVAVWCCCFSSFRRVVFCAFCVPTLFLLVLLSFRFYFGFNFDGIIKL